jgi:PadR family transcriptional regulator
MWMFHAHTLTSDNRRRYGIVERQGMASTRPDLLQGTLDLLILKALNTGPLHGWAIAKRIQQMSRDVLTATQGSLYPALYRIEDRGWIAGFESESAEGRRIKVYRLTASGRKQLSQQIDSWRTFAAAMDHVILTD